MSKALLIIDYTITNVFPEEYKDQPNKIKKITGLYKNIQKLINKCRLTGIEIIWIVPVLTSKSNLPSNLVEIINKRKPSTTKGIPLDKIYKLIPDKKDKIMEKYSYSAFSGTKGKLHKYLKSKGIDKLFISGIYSTTCVDATIVEAFGLGYFLDIYENCVETVEIPFSQNLQKSLLLNWKYKYGNVLNI